MKRATVSFILIAVCALSACRGNSSGANLKELQRARSGDLDVVLLSEDGSLAHGKGAATLEFRRASGGDLVDVGTVKMNATMPMAGMAPMLGSTFVRPSGTPGRYAIESDLTMAGTWQLAVEWNGPAGNGKVTFPGTVQ